MKKGQTVTVTASFHAYRGHTGTITRIYKDDEGVMLFVKLGNGREVMLDPSDVREVR